MYSFSGSSGRVYRARQVSQSRTMIALPYVTTQHTKPGQFRSSVITPATSPANAESSESIGPLAPGEVGPAVGAAGVLFWTWLNAPPRPAVAGARRKRRP